MEAATLTSKLQTRAQTALLNPSEITPESVATAVNETMEMLLGRELPMWRTLDIAMFRLHLLLKSQPSELETDMYKAAINALERIPMPTPPAAKVSGAVVRARDTEW